MNSHSKMIVVFRHSRQDQKEGAKIKDKHGNIKVSKLPDRIKTDETRTSNDQIIIVSKT